MYITYLNKFLEYFGAKRKIKLLIFAIMGLIAGLLEFVGIAMIYPFVMIIVNPTAVNTYTKYVPDFVMALPPLSIAMVFGATALGLFILKNLYMILFMFVQCKFLQKWTQSINNYFMDFFLYAPHNVVQKIPNSEKLYILNTLSNQATTGFITRIVTLITNIIIVASVIMLILCKFFVAGSISFIFVVLTILIQNKLLKRGVSEINNRIVKVAKGINNITYSNINNIKEIKIQGVERIADNLYEKFGKEITDLYAKLNFFSAMSPYLVETIIVMSLIVLGLMILLQTGGQQYTLIASYAMLVAAIFRIAPALNRIQSSLINLPPTLKFVIELTDICEKYELQTFNYSDSNDTQKSEFNNTIELKNINFSYNKETPVLKDISFKLNKGDFVGIIGLSGAGKSTLADVLTGLLPPESGQILVDGKEITTELYHGFRKLIGYVSQDIRIMDCSFRENVAWMQPANAIDDQKVELLLKSVKLWDVVETYKNGIYSTPIVGESGLSKGQMQRLAIARALYRDPELILLDEATSALDVKTEHEIINTLKDYSKDKTIISIAHRLSVLQACNKLIYMEAGRIKDVGNFTELADKYPDFAELVKLSGLETENK